VSPDIRLIPLFCSPDIRSNSSNFLFDFKARIVFLLLFTMPLNARRGHRPGNSGKSHCRVLLFAMGRRFARAHSLGITERRKEGFDLGTGMRGAHDATHHCKACHAKPKHLGRAHRVNAPDREHRHGTCVRNVAKGLPA
jgi:hypothetical protein